MNQNNSSPSESLKIMCVLSSQNNALVYINSRSTCTVGIMVTMVTIRGDCEPGR